MTIPETQAKEFAKEYYNSVDNNLIHNLQGRLESKLYFFKKDKDKLDFLKVLIQDINLDTEKHESDCKTIGCMYREEKELGLFLIHQEIDSINEYFEFIPKKEDTFTTEDEISMHNKLNEIIEKLKDQGLGQEVLFEEIESLKSHFNLGKKTWFQLLKGKLVEVSAEKVIELTVIKSIVDILSDGYDYGSKWLE